MRCQYCSAAAHVLKERYTRTNRKWLMDEYRSNLIPLNQIKCYQPHESSSLKINRFPPAQIKTLSLLQFRRNETFEQFSSENVLNLLNKYEKIRKIYGQIVHTYLKMTSNTISWNGKLEIQHCKSNKPCCLRAIFTLVLAYPCCIEWWQINYSRCMVCLNFRFTFRPGIHQIYFWI